MSIEDVIEEMQLVFRLVEGIEIEIVSITVNNPEGLNICVIEY